MSQVIETPFETAGLARPIDLGTLALAAVATSVGEAVLKSERCSEANYLLEKLRATEQSDWEFEFLRQLDAPAACDTPLVELASVIGLSRVELIAVALAVTSEVDLMAGRALAYLQDPMGSSRPTLGLLATAFETVMSCEPIEDLLIGAALRCGLIQFVDDQVPLPERQLRVPSHLCLALRGKDGHVSGCQIGLQPDDRVVFPDSVLKEAQRHADALHRSGRPSLVVRCGSQYESQSIAAIICEALGKRPLYLDAHLPTGVGPWLELRGLIPVNCYRLSPGERKSIPSFLGYDGIQLAICGVEGMVDNGSRPTTSWFVPTPTKEERRDLWFTALGDVELAHELANQHRHRCGRIGELARLARYHQQLSSNGSQLEMQDVYAASWAGSAGELDSLAQPLRDPVPDEALIVNKSLRNDLETLLIRCTARDGLTENLGISAATRYQPGVRALFVGPSGTGKTLAVGWLATRLRVPLYRVDLAAVSSKYIGETEKNLSQLFSIAEQSEVVLLFDEADSLFGKRTDVEHANDRFANAQTNYLLQRIESYEGIAVLTSNSRSRFDPAFARRLDLIIEFPNQSANERRQLWRAHLGSCSDLTAGEINKLSALADLAGGHIRNVVLSAAAMAKATGRKINYQDIVQGMESEYRKIGRQMPVTLKH